MEGVKNIQRASFLFYFAKLSPAQSISNSVGWAEIALISTFTHSPTPHPQGKYREGNFNTGIGQI